MPQELTTHEKNELAQNKLNELLKWKQIAGMSYLQLGKILKDFKEQKLYENLGEESIEYESFQGFLSMPEINIKIRKAYYLIQIYDLFCLQLNFKPEELSEISWTSLRSILPVVRKENAKNLIEDAKVLRRADLDIKIAQIKAGITEPEKCKHEWEEIKFWRCITCHENSKMKPTDGNIIKE